MIDLKSATKEDIQKKKKSSSYSCNATWYT